MSPPRRNESFRLGWVVAAFLAANACSCPGVTFQPTDGGESSDDGGELQADAGGELQGDGGATDSGDAGADGGIPLACAGPVSGAGTDLTTGLNGPRHLALDDRGLYVTESGNIGLPTPNGRVLRIPLDGGTAQPLLDALEGPDAVAADGTEIWVLDSNHLWRIDSATGDAGWLPPPVNNADFGTTDLAIAPSDVVVATGERWLARVPKNGGTIRALFAGDAGDEVNSVELEGTQVWFLVANSAAPGIYHSQLGTGPKPFLVHATANDARDLRLFPGAFMWAEGDGGFGSVKLWPRDAGPEEILADGLQGPAAPTFVDNVLYVRDTAKGASQSTFLGQADCADGGLMPVGPTLWGPGDMLWTGTQLFYTSPALNHQGTVGVLP